MHLPAATGHMENAAIERCRRTAHNDEGQEDERGEQGVERQYRNDRIAFQSLLLKRIIAAQQRRRHKCQYQPHLSKL